MRSMMKKILSILVLVVFVLLSACDAITTTSIKDVLNNPRKFSEKEIQIKGQVVEVFSLIVVKYFVVQDSTGEIAVVTNKPLPKKGQSIKIKGKVQEAFSLGDEQLLVLVEDGMNR